MSAHPIGPLAAGGRRAWLAQWALAPLAARLSAPAGVASALGLGLGGAGAAHAASAFPLSLRKGVNLAHWFEYDGRHALTAPELAGLRAAGFDHVRLPLDPLAQGWSPNAPSRLPFAPALERAIADALAGGLAVILDLHLQPEHKLALESDSSYQPVLLALWSELAALGAAAPVNRLGFELFNEPQFYGWRAPQWPPLLRRLLATVRAKAPDHGVLLSGNQGGSLEALLALTPEPDPRAAYTFHYYDPFLFTHQALPWLDPRWTSAGSRGDVLYPAQRHAQRPPRTLSFHPRADREWAEYMAADWNAERLAADMARAGDWSRQHGVPVLCTEFGVIRAKVDPDSRYQWLRDMRTALQAQGIGWTVWDYTHIFGITVESERTGQAGRRTLEPAACAALALGCGG